MDAGQTAPTPVVKQNTVVPWLRRMNITIGPLRDSSSSTDGPVFQFASDGTMNSLKVTAKIQKKIIGFPPPSTISIYNLSRETRNSIIRGRTKIVIEAGWENTELEQVFKGGVLAVATERNGADLVTKLTCLPGAGILAAFGSFSFGSGSSVKNAVKQLAAKAEGIEVTDSNMKDVKGSFGKKGWSFAGLIKDGLTRLGEEFGFSWFVENNALMVVGDKAKFDGMVELNGNEGGLMQITPLLSGPFQWQRGVKIQAMYIPGVLPGHMIRVKSTINEALNQDYKVHTLSISLDTFSDDWTMDIESYRYYLA